MEKGKPQSVWPRKMAGSEPGAGWGGGGGEMHLEAGLESQLFKMLRGGYWFWPGIYGHLDMEMFKLFLTVTENLNSD